MVVGRSCEDLVKILIIYPGRKYKIGLIKGQCNPVISVRAPRCVHIDSGESISRRIGALKNSNLRRILIVDSVDSESVIADPANAVGVQRPTANINGLKIQRGRERRHRRDKQGVPARAHASI